MSPLPPPTAAGSSNSNIVHNNVYYGAPPSSPPSLAETEPEGAEDVFFEWVAQKKYWTRHAEELQLLREIMDKHAYTLPTLQRMPESLWIDTAVRRGHFDNLVEHYSVWCSIQKALKRRIRYERRGWH